MIDISNAHNLNKLSWTFISVVSITLILISVLSLIIENYAVALIAFMVPLIVLAFIRFDKFSVSYFVGSLFFANYFYWELRIQLCLIAGVILFLVFISNIRHNIYNTLQLPKLLKYLGITLVVYIFISSLLSPHFNSYSLYYAFYFFVFMCTSYVLFRSVTDIGEIEKLLDLFVLATFLSGLLIIIRILMTGKIRSLGVTGFAIMDYNVVALLIIIFKNLLLGKPTKKSLIFLLVIFVILITTQSRFAWLGFLLTFIYGLIISWINSGEARVMLSKRFAKIFLAFIFLLAVIFVTGLGNILLDRILDINFSFFQSDEGKWVSNSLESRILIWIVAINAFMQNPITGIGYMMFSEVSEHYNVLPELVYQIFVENLDAHTTYLNFLCETGIIGLSLFLAYVITVYILTLKSIKLSMNKIEKNVSIILNLIVFFIMVHSVYSGAFTFGQSAFLMHFIFALAIANYLFVKTLKLTGYDEINDSK